MKAAIALGLLLLLDDHRRGRVVLRDKLVINWIVVLWWRGVNGHLELRVKTHHIRMHLWNGVHP